MLKINLLPEGARKATLSPIEQFHRTPMMWIAVAGLVGFALALLVPIGIRRHQLHQLNVKIRLLEPRKQEVDQIQKLLQQLRVQEVAFQGLKRGQSLWSKRLNILSNVVPDGIWFTELALDPGKGLIVQGAALGQGGSEMVNVGRLVQDLKDAPDFSSAMKEIQIESIKRAQEKEVEIVEFTLACTLREGQAP
jgi:Tfp pilus assembly protein PilN